MKTKQKVMLTSLGIIITAAALFAGSSVTFDGDKVHIKGERLDTGPQEEGYEYSKLESLLRKARDFAQIIAAQCEEEEEGALPGANNEDMGDVADKLNGLINGENLCLEGKGSQAGTSDEWSMATNSYPEGEFQTPEGKTVEFRHADGVGPSININLKGLKGHLSDETMCDPTIGDIANVAGVLMHESFHALNNHKGTDEDEQAAYKFHAKFLCCAIDAINADSSISQEDKDAAIEQICGDLKKSEEVYCSKYKGQGPLFNPTECGCPEAEGSPWPVAEEKPNGSPVPRERLESNNFMGDTASFGLVNQSFQITHAPNVGKLFVKRVTPTHTESWDYEMDSLVGGGVETVGMLQARSKEIFFAARNLSVGTGILLHCDVGWNGEHPVLNFSTVIESVEIGDITALQDLSELNNCIALFDFTNAKLWYVDKSDGSLRLAGSSAAIPEILDFQGLTSGPLWDETELIGVIHWLGKSQNSRLMQLGSVEFLQLKDFEGDASIEGVQPVGVIEF